MKGSIPALVTPFSSDGTIDFAAFERLLYHVAPTSDGVVIAGTTGEGPALSDEEMLSLLSFAKERLAIPILAAVGTSSTAKSLHRLQQAKDRGIDGALIIIPYYVCPPLRGIIAHFEVLAKEGVPLILYHHPRRTGTSLSAENLAYIAERVELAAIKEALGSIPLLKELVERTKVPILSGEDMQCLSMIQNGAQGSISVLANAFPDRWQKIVRGEEAPWSELKEIAKIVFSDVNPSGIKCLLKEMGIIENILRLPLLPAQPWLQDALAAATLVGRESI